MKQLDAIKDKHYLKSIIAAMPDLIFLLDENGKYIDVLATNKEQLLYKPKNEIIDKTVRDFFDEELSEQFIALIHKTIETQTVQSMEYELKFTAQKEYFEARVMPTQIKENGIYTVIVIVRDITEMHLSRLKIRHLSTHDSLTDLPNRALLFEQINHSILSAKRDGSKGSLFFIDIDGFKDINDNYSHKIGDLLLKEFAHRLSQITRESDIVGRLSGDEFLLLLENVKEMDDILGVVEKIKIQLSEPFFINNERIDITVSIGIACYPTDGEDADQLIHAADQAMYSVKKSGKDGFTFYTKEFSRMSSNYFFIQNALKKAIREDDFTILYQPQFSLDDASLTGLEALLRCNNDDISDIPISRLITIAEESNLIHNISRFVMERCCSQIKEWQDLSIAPLKIAVNLSRKELGDENLLPIIKKNLSACSIDPQILEFEITESTLLQNNQLAKENIEQLREIGCSFSIDDYGTGYSSLSNLREFQLDKIKIDRSFIEDLTDNDNDKIIVSTTISMIKQLGLTVLAEGVENEAQANLLSEYGCDEVQGYYYSYPLNAEKVTKLLQEQ
jgi:diguanylate cyclase (GGDEF)-like protein/PAS domain S-box-containing protein